MISFLRWIIGLFIAFLILFFAISNRQDVELYLSPLHGPYEYPLYVVELGALAFGFLLGCFTVWLNMAPVRRTKRQQRRKIKDLEKALEVSIEAQATKTPPDDFFPALPHKQD